MNELTQSHKVTKITKEEREELSKRVIGAAIEVHKQLGPGLLESVYECCMVDELQRRGINVRSQIPVPLFYKGKELKKEFKLDLLVENELVLELKAVENIIPLYEVQLLTYLRLTNKTLGLLINFNEVLLKNGLRRVINGYN